MTRPLLSKIDSWANHEARVLKAVVLALEILRSRNPDLAGESEDVLNCELYLCMLEAVRKLGGADSGLDSPPAYDCTNQPLEDEDHLDIARKKRPDFQWSYIDHTLDPRRSARHYYVECKRLGTPVRSDWVFNENYVAHGILRFVRREWNYGRDSSSGAMIGYVQSMEGAEILAEVNHIARDNDVVDIEIGFEGWKVRGVSSLAHDLDRPEISPTPFNLKHFWVDLRTVLSNTEIVQRSNAG